MSDFQVNVIRIDDAYDHPDADRLTVIVIGGYLCIANKHEDGTPRYKTGDLVVYIPEQAVMPELMMKSMDFWDVNKNKPAFRYVKAKKLRGIFSQGILYPVDKDGSVDVVSLPGMAEGLIVWEGDNVAEFLGITKWEPVIPANMSGQISGEYIEYAKVFDTESIQKNWNMFEDGEWVSVTEKIHGTQIIIEYIPGINDPLLFGETHSFAVTSKGVGRQGFIYKNLVANEGNLYVETLRRLLLEGLEACIADYVSCYNSCRNEYLATDGDDIGELKTLHLMGEIFGSGVQDLSYGQKTPTVNFFDIAVNKVYLEPEGFIQAVDEILQLPRVPVLYEGPFDRNLIEGLRDGLDSLSGTHIREGIVIKGRVCHPKYGRKVAKWVSEAYLLRKNGTEYN